MIILKKQLKISVFILVNCTVFEGATKFGIDLKFNNV